MRIAYVANYQGQDLVDRRPCVYNLSLAARVKIQLIAELLVAGSHDVEILSQGQVEREWAAKKRYFRYYRGFTSEEPFDPRVPVFYASALALPFLTGLWEVLQMRSLLRRRHCARPFDLVLLYNLQRAQVGCAGTGGRLGLPVVLQYEDDSFVTIQGETREGLIARYHRRRCREALARCDACIGVSPYLMAQAPSHVPKLLLRGIVSEQVLKFREPGSSERCNRVVFSGTHERTQGLEQLVQAWRSLALKGWELHIAGQGPLTSALMEAARGDGSIVFHGLLNREENARLLCTARVGVNPQDPTRTPGNVFAFKIVEYLAANLHVMTTPRGVIEPELEVGVTYIERNTAEAIAAGLVAIIDGARYEHTAGDAAVRNYGPAAVGASLAQLLGEVMGRRVMAAGRLTT